MSDDSILKKIGWQKSVPYESILPMPNFDLRSNTDFDQIDANKPYKLARTMIERFPAVLTMPTEHPAFKVALATLNQNPGVNLTPIDWAWHREVLKHARINEEARRIFNRNDFERFTQDLHRELEIRREYDKRAFHFAEAVKGKLEQAWQSIDSYLNPYESKVRGIDQSLGVFNKSKRSAFILAFVRKFGPNRKPEVHYLGSDGKASVAFRNKSISHPGQLNAFEVIVQEFSRFYPTISPNLIKTLFQKWEPILNSVTVSPKNEIYFRQSVGKIAAPIFALQDARNKQSVPSNLVAFPVSRGQSNPNNLEDLAFADHHPNTAELDLQLNRLVANIYNERDLSFHRHRSEALSGNVALAANSAVGTHPTNVTNKIQFSLISTWVSNVHMVRDQHGRNFSEIVDSINEVLKWTNSEGQESMFKTAVEYESMMDAQRMRDLRQNYTLEQIMKMFAATASASNLLVGFHSNTIASQFVNGDTINKSSSRIVDEVFGSSAFKRI